MRRAETTETDFLPERQIERLAQFLVQHMPWADVPGGAIADTAIRVIENLQSRVRALEQDQVPEGRALRFRAIVKAATAVAKEDKDESEPTLTVSFKVEATEDQIAAGDGIPIGEQAAPWAMKLLTEITKVGALVTVERRPVYAEQQTLAEAAAQAPPSPDGEITTGEGADEQAQGEALEGPAVADAGADLLTEESGAPA